MITAPVNPGLKIPAHQLSVPASLAKQLDAAAATGVRAAGAAPSSFGDVQATGAFATTMIGPFPGPEKTLREIAQLHDIADHRTPEGSQTAIWYGQHGAVDIWTHYLKDYESVAGTTAARAGAQLLNSALKFNDEITDIAKDSYNRARPFQTDPTLKTLSKNPPSSFNPSYPSGHTSMAFTGAAIMSFLMPERAAEFQEQAREVAYSRLYMGVHHPSDIIAGAKVGALAGALAVQASPAVPVAPVAA